MCQILNEPNKILRTIATEIPLDEIPSKKIKDVLACMKTELHTQPDGVAIAAPQIGKSVRIFMIAGFVFDLKKKNKFSTPSPDKIFINPKIIKTSKETKWVSGEGCLSVRWIYGTTKRHKQATVEAYDETGKKFTMNASGLVAQIFQHETDHLNGILFTDHAKDIKHMTDQEIADYQIELQNMRH